jgi:hypothetical protein
MCGMLGIEKGKPVYGPFEGEYEYLCRGCGQAVEALGPLKWKKHPLVEAVEEEVVGS